MGRPIGTVAIEFGGDVRRFVATSSEHSVAPYALIKDTPAKYLNQRRQRSGGRLSPVEISDRSRVSARMADFCVFGCRISRSRLGTISRMVIPSRDIACMR